ncbi:MAG: hydrolase [Lachnospiraceae bacterium]|nr:hydrolase [Lachnospiraceae bacterium]
MKFYTSDLHFGHEKVIAFDNRPFSDLEEMEKVMINRWNVKVQPKDDVYILGDFIYRNLKPEEWYLEQLHGKKHLVVGNHDYRLLQNEKAMSYFESVDKMMHVADMGKQICLCHFPIAEWNGFYHGSYHIYGHIHSDTGETYQFMKRRERALNAGCMLNNYAPATFQEIIKNNQDFKIRN